MGFKGKHSGVLWVVIMYSWCVTSNWNHFLSCFFGLLRNFTKHVVCILEIWFAYQFPLIHLHVSLLPIHPIWSLFLVTGLLPDIFKISLIGTLYMGERSFTWITYSLTKLGRKRQECFLRHWYVILNPHRFISCEHQGLITNYGLGFYEYDCGLIYSYPGSCLPAKISSYP